MPNYNSSDTLSYLIAKKTQGWGYHPARAFYLNEQGTQLEYIDVQDEAAIRKLEGILHSKSSSSSSPFGRTAIRPSASMIQDYADKVATQQGVKSKPSEMASLTVMHMPTDSLFWQGMLSRPRQWQSTKDITPDAAFSLIARKADYDSGSGIPGNTGERSNFVIKSSGDDESLYVQIDNSWLDEATLHRLKARLPATEKWDDPSTGTNP